MYVFEMYLYGLYLQMILLYSFISDVFLLNNPILFSIPVWVIDFLLIELSSFTFAVVILAFMYLVARCRNSSSVSKMEIQWLQQPGGKSAARDPLSQRLDTPEILSLCLPLLLTTFVHTHHSTHLPSFILKVKKCFRLCPFEQTLEKEYNVHCLCQIPMCLCARPVSRAGQWVGGGW